MTPVVTELLKEMKAAWQLPKKITVSEWADAYRVLPESSAESGKWHTSRTPYLKGPMDAFSDSYVREIVMMFSTQVGKTESALNMLGYVADQDPAPTLWVGPKEADVKSFCTERIQPLFNLSEELIKKLSSNKDEINRQGITLDRMRLHMAWAGSPSGLASRAIKYVFRDEVDKYPPYSGKESDPIELSNERTKTFWDYKAIDVSTPTTEYGYIYKAYNRTNMMQYYVPCPFCGHYQTLKFRSENREINYVKFPADVRDPIKIKDERLAWYECEECEKKIIDNHKFEMLNAGVWVPNGCTINKKGKVKGEGLKSKRVGFWLNALYSPWLTFSDVVAKFLESKDDPPKLMNFTNSWLAQVWQETSKSTSIDIIKTKRTGYSKGEVPNEALVLTAGIDVQKRGFYFVIRAWGYNQENWLIREDKLESSGWGELWIEVFETQYMKLDGTKLYVRLGNLDTGGGTTTDGGGNRTAETYMFCRKHPDRTRAIKGKDTLQGEIFRAKLLDKYPDGKPLRGGLTLWHLDNEFLKDKLHAMIYADEESAYKWHLHRKPSKAYLQHMVGEHKVPVRDKKTGRNKGDVWQKTKQSVRVDYWDCECYALAAAHMLGVHLLTPPKESRVYKDESSSRSEQGSNSWVGNTDNWL